MRASFSALNRVCSANKTSSFYFRLALKISLFFVSSETDCIKASYCCLATISSYLVFSISSRYRSASALNTIVYWTDSSLIFDRSDCLRGDLLGEGFFAELNDNWLSLLRELRALNSCVMLFTRTLTSSLGLSSETSPPVSSSAVVACVEGNGIRPSSIVRVDST